MSQTVSRSLILQLLGIIVLSSVAIATMAHFVLEAPFFTMLIVLLVGESILGIGFIVYRAFVSGLG